MDVFIFGDFPECPGSQDASEVPALLDAYTTAGPIEGYKYFMRNVEGLGDVVINSPSPGQVRIYAAYADGRPADNPLIINIAKALSDERVRPLTDHLQITWADPVTYNIDLDYYPIEGQDAAEIVASKVNEFIKWQGEKLGRSINPSKLEQMLMETGVIERVVIYEPAYHSLDRGDEGNFDTSSSEYRPEQAVIGTINLHEGEREATTDEADGGDSTENDG